MKSALITILLLFSTSSFARFYLQHSIGYESYTEDVENTKFGLMKNMLFIGASIGGAERFYFGQSLLIHSYTFNSSSSATGTLSITEIGPRFIWFLNKRMTWNFSFAWHPYAKGKRSLTSSSETTDTSGGSMVATLAYQLPVTKTFYLGASINYYTYSVKEDTTSAGVSTTVSQKYTHIVPMFDISFRFR